MAFLAKKDTSEQDKAIRDAKKALRKDIRGRLSALSDDDLAEQSQRAQQAILHLPKYQAASRIGIYLSMPKGEAQTGMLLHDALKTGKKVYVPYISGAGRSSVIDMLRLESVREFESLERDSWGIPTLPADTVDRRENAAGGTGLVDVGEQDEDMSAPGRDRDESLDVIVLPGVAFDYGLSRLGHGAGYYDSFLTRFCKDGTRKPYLIGLCLKEQLLPEGGEVPTTNSDWILDAVAVGDGRVLTMDD